jgi:hypothetical protein
LPKLIHLDLFSCSLYCSDIFLSLCSEFASNLLLARSSFTFMFRAVLRIPFTKSFPYHRFLIFIYLLHDVFIFIFPLIFSFLILFLQGARIA